MPEQVRPLCRIGIDVGGTFTDFVLANGATGQLTRHKEPSVPSDPSLSVERGLMPLIEKAGVRPEDVGVIMHGTTLLVNAIIQRRGAKVGLVVSKGHRGILEIGRGRLASTYDLRVRKEEPLVPRNLILETSARIAADGAVLARPTVAEMDGIAETFQREGIEAVTVLLLHSYAHSDLENEVVAALSERLPGVPVIGSAVLWPERREFERSIVAVMNAYVQPIMQNYLDRLRARLEARGFTMPIYITASNGGTLSLGTARERPIETILSGPASGVTAAIEAASNAGIARFVTVDLGGTSADVAVTMGGAPTYTTNTHVADFPLVLPVVNVSAIGAGGGSVIWVDPQGVLKVGPQSAGADPGPICYGRGGDKPTLTDCYLVLGYIDPAHFLGGRMALQVERAREALDAIGAKLGYPAAERAERAAEAALRVATAMMATEIGKSLTRYGQDSSDFALMAFGGAGPTHASLLAEEAQFATLVVPPGSATFCALGAALSDVKRDYVHSRHLKLANADAGDNLAAIFETLRAEAGEWLAREGDLLGGAEYAMSCDMRYAGQAFDLAVALPDDAPAPWNVELLAELFHREHEKAYGFRDLRSAVEVTTQRLRVVGRMPRMHLPAIAETAGVPSATGHRAIYHAGETLEVPVYDRRALGSGATLPGPAVVEQEDSTVWVLPGWSVSVDRVGNLIIRAPGASGDRT